MVQDEKSHDKMQSWPDGEGPLRIVPRNALNNEPDREQPDKKLIIDVDGYEGPLDLLLQLARQQKVDLAKISILALAEQYLGFIHKAKRMRLELAADYLVMAAWLAYLKSRLLVPSPPEDDEIPAEEMAARLAFRLQRLNAMREAAAQLMARNLLGRDVFGRGAPEPLRVETRAEYSETIYDLLQAYTERRQKNISPANYTIRKLPLWSIKQARQTLYKLLGGMDDWGQFDHYLAEYLAEPEMRRSVLASSFSASLELVREGQLEVRQKQAFKAIFMRRSISDNAPISATEE